LQILFIFTILKFGGTKLQYLVISVMGLCTVFASSEKYLTGIVHWLLQEISCFYF